MPERDSAQVMKDIDETEEILAALDTELVSNKMSVLYLEMCVNK